MMQRPYSLLGPMASAPYAVGERPGGSYIPTIPLLSGVDAWESLTGKRHEGYAGSPRPGDFPADKKASLRKLAAPPRFRLPPGPAWPRAPWPGSHSVPLPRSQSPLYASPAITPPKSQFDLPVGAALPPGRSQRAHATLLKAMPWVAGGSAATLGARTLGDAIIQTPAETAALAAKAKASPKTPAAAPAAGSDPQQVGGTPAAAGASEPAAPDASGPPSGSPAATPDHLGNALAWMGKHKVPLAAGGVGLAALYALQRKLQQEDPEERRRRRWEQLPKLAAADPDKFVQERPLLSGFLLACHDAGLPEAAIAEGLEKAAAANAGLAAELVSLGGPSVNPKLPQPPWAAGGEAKQAGLGGDMVGNAGRATLGAAGAVGGGIMTTGTGLATLGSGAWNQTAGRLGAPKSPTQLFKGLFNDSVKTTRSGLWDLGQTYGLGGLNATSSQYAGSNPYSQSQVGQHLDEIRSRPGVTPLVKNISRVGQGVATVAPAMIAAAPVMGALPGASSSSALAGPSAASVPAMVAGTGRAAMSAAQLARQEAMLHGAQAAYSPVGQAIGQGARAVVSNPVTRNPLARAAFGGPGIAMDVANQAGLSPVPGGYGAVYQGAKALADHTGEGAARLQRAQQLQGALAGDPTYQELTQQARDDLLGSGLGEKEIAKRLQEMQSTIIGQRLSLARTAPDQYALPEAASKLLGIGGGQPPAAGPADSAAQQVGQEVGAAAATNPNLPSNQPVRDPNMETFTVGLVGDKLQANPEAAAKLPTIAQEVQQLGEKADPQQSQAIVQDFQKNDPRSPGRQAAAQALAAQGVPEDQAAEAAATMDEGSGLLLTLGLGLSALGTLWGLMDDESGLMPWIMALGGLGLAGHSQGMLDGVLPPEMRMSAPAGATPASPTASPQASPQAPAQSAAEPSAGGSAGPVKSGPAPAGSLQAMLTDGIDAAEERQIFASPQLLSQAIQLPDEQLLAALRTSPTGSKLKEAYQGLGFFEQTMAPSLLAKAWQLPPGKTTEIGGNRVSGLGLDPQQANRLAKLIPRL